MERLKIPTKQEIDQAFSEFRAAKRRAKLCAEAIKKHKDLLLISSPFLSKKWRDHYEQTLNFSQTENKGQ